MNKKIMLVEDNPEINKTNRRMLELNGYKVLTADTLKKAWEHVWRENPDLIVLDIMMPDGSGLDFCRELRAHDGAMPILFLTALDENADVVTGLRAGGDDYLAKPYDYNVLLARIEALLRRAQYGYVENIGSYQIDHVAQRVYRDGEDMLLKPREFALFCLFAENPGAYFTPGVLYERIWGGSALEDVRTVYAHVSSLRKKLGLYGDATIDIEQKRGKGYRLTIGSGEKTETE